MAQRVRFLVPDLWADHHVLRARKALLAAPGVGAVYASSAFKEVAIEFDPAVASPEALAALLASAGYPPSAAAAGADGQVVYGEADAMWRERGSRTTKTNSLDIQMSGDFRQY